MKRTKTILTLLISLTSLSGAIAQYGDTSGGDYVRPITTYQNASTASHIISFGFGMGGDYPYMGVSSVQDPGLSLSYQNTIMQNAGLGSLMLGGVWSFKSIYTSLMDYNNGYSYKQRWNYYMTGGKISYHVFAFTLKKIEAYAGAMYAYYITTFKFSTNDPNTSKISDPGNSLTFNHSPNFFAPGIFAGVRSWVSPRSSVWVEVGYGYSAVSFGASYKI